MKKLLLALFLIAFSAPLPAFAGPEAEDELVEIQAGKPFTPRADRAYLLLRTNSKGISPVFMRVPTGAELERYDAAKRDAFAKEGPKLVNARNRLLADKDAAEKAGQKFTKAIPPEPSIANFNFVYDGVVNAQTVSMGRAFEKGAEQRTMLIEAVPGSYVVLGIGYANIMQTCLCLGTVSFAAEPGRITDLGTMFMFAASEESPFPELAGETGLGASMNGHIFLWAAAIRPSAPGTPVPAVPGGMPVAPAGYRATGKFVVPFAFGVNRLAPIPGILGYDRGDVLDLVNHTVAENHYE